jgi:hypothetical protein
VKQRSMVYKKYHQTISPEKYDKNTTTNSFFSSLVKTSFVFLLVSSGFAGFYP